MSTSNGTTTSSQPRVAIVGGGLLGMSLALRLTQAGAKVSLFEASSNAGGLAEEAQFGSYRWDRYYHVVLLSDLRTRGLLSELGMADQMRWGISKTGFYTDGKLYSMSNTVEFLKFPPFEKAVMGDTPIEKLEKMLAVDWLRRYSGANVLQRIWLPLLKSKLGSNFKIANAAFIWAIIARMYAARRSGLKQEMFGYLAAGYGPVVRALESRLKSLGVDFRLNAPVADVASTDGQATVQVDGQGREEFDHVVMTTTPHLAARVCSNLENQEMQRMLNIPYQGVICAAVLLKRPLSPYYVTNITDDWVPFTGVIEMTALADKAAFGGNSLVYLPLYLPQDDPAWQESDDSIRMRFVAALSRMYPDFSEQDILDFSVSRARQVLAIPTVDYSRELLPPVSQSMPNISFVNSAQIAHGTLNVNETLGLVEEKLPGLTAALGVDLPPSFHFMPDEQEVASMTMPTKEQTA
jgi:protoporphyrinogen oxidase